MKRIISIIYLDLLNSIRNNILLFSIIGPVICAIIVSIYLPSTKNINLYFSAGPEISNIIIHRLTKYGDTEVLSSHEKVKRRVLELDNVTGIIYKDSTYQIIFEGDEPKGFKEKIFFALYSVLSTDNNFIFKDSVLNEKTSYNRELFTSIFIFAGFFLSGIVVGFNMVEDKESKVIQAFTISPLTFKDYLVGRCCTGLILIFFINVLSTVIIYGFEFNWIMFLIIIISGSLITITLLLSIAVFAKSQIYAIGLVKLFLLIYFLVPFLVKLMPGYMIWIWGIFPNLWLYTMIENVFTNNDRDVITTFIPAFGLFIFSSLIINIILLKKFKKNIAFRN